MDRCLWAKPSKADRLWRMLKETQQNGTGAGLQGMSNAARVEVAGEKNR